MTSYLASLAIAGSDTCGGPRQRARARALAGYKDALREARVKFDGGAGGRRRFQPGSGEAAAVTYLGPKLPDAIFACNDAMAMGLSAGAQRSCRSATSRRGFDDIEFAEAYIPPSEIRQARRDIGERAVAYC